MATPTASSLPPEAVALASRMFEAARRGQMDIFQQALAAGLPATLTNDKGDSLVRRTAPLPYSHFPTSPPPGTTLPLLPPPSPTFLPPSPAHPQLTPPSPHLQIMLASYHGHAPLVALLLAHGADPNALNDRGQSPLAGAVFKDETEVVELLVEGGADPLWGSPSAEESMRLFRKEGEWAVKFEGARGRGRAGGEEREVVVNGEGERGMSEGGGGLGC
ncbi:hypothetical protein MMC27_001602 [Xylographa pallens]|nr:hypothetical protein [Xylographa pallens]